MENNSRKANAGTPPADPEPTPKASFAFQPTFNPPVKSLPIDTPSTSHNNTDVIKPQKDEGRDAASLSLASVSTQEMPPCQHCSAQPQSTSTKDEFKKILDSQAEQLSQSRRKLAASEEEKYKLSDEVIRESAAKALLQGRIEEQEKAMETLRTEKTILEGQICDERRAKEEAQRSRDNAMEEVKQAEATKHESELTKIKEQMDIERRDYAEEIRKMNELLNGEKAKVTSEKAEKEELKKQVEKVTEETNTLKASNSRLLNAQNNLNMERTERNVEKKKFEEEIANLKKEVSSAQETKEKLQSVLDQRKATIEELEKRISTLEAKVTTVSKENEKLESALKLESKDEVRKAKIEELERRVATLQANVATAAKDKEQLESALLAESAKQKEQKELSDKRINMINTSSNNMRSNLEKKTLEVTQLKSKVDSLEKELVTERVEVQRLTDENTAASSKINKMEKERQEEVRKMTIQISGLREDTPMKDAKRLQAELEAEKDVRLCEKKLHNKEMDALKEENLRNSKDYEEKIASLNALLEEERQKMNKRTSASANSGKLLAALIYACDSDMKEAFMQNSMKILNNNIPTTGMNSEAATERVSPSNAQSTSEQTDELSPRQGSSNSPASFSDKHDQPQSRKRLRKE